MKKGLILTILMATCLLVGCNNKKLITTNDQDTEVFATIAETSEIETETESQIEYITQADLSDPDILISEFHIWALRMKQRLDVVNDNILFECSEEQREDGYFSYLIEMYQFDNFAKHMNTLPEKQYPEVTRYWNVIHNELTGIRESLRENGYQNDRSPLNTKRFNGYNLLIQNYILQIPPYISDEAYSKIIAEESLDVESESYLATEESTLAQEDSNSEVTNMLLNKEPKEENPLLLDKDDDTEFDD